MEVIYKDGIKYQLEKFSLESEFEEIVLSQYEYIFGPRAILFGKQKISTAIGRGTIPDAFVVSPDKKKWYVLEIELAIHSGYGHVANQILKFKGAVEADRKKLFNFFDKEIENDLYKKAKWQNRIGPQPDIHRELYTIIDKEPEILIIIDEQNKELDEAKTKMNFVADVLIVKCFSRVNSNRTDLIFMFDELASTAKPGKSQSLPTLIKSQNSSKAQNHISDIHTTTNSSELTVLNKRISKPSPSCHDWLKGIPELATQSNLNSWKDICNYLGLDVKSDSARRILRKWVAKNKPNWNHVPD